LVILPFGDAFCCGEDEFMKTEFNQSEMLETKQDDDVVLSVQGVSKRFCRDLKRSLFYGVQDMAGELLGSKGEKTELRPKEFWAVKDVSFELRRGEALGLVGKNGSGKTTLLRIIAGLIKPDAGLVKVKGRIAPLIALGAGFSPILTGRENIYTNMSILGLSKQEIDERFDEVVEFAEIGDAIDAPVQSYSSGMAARLGFASAIHTEPDILLVDEVLAVGDFKFRNKCRRKLNSLLSQGTSLILVSHQSQMILNICEKAVYLNKGKLIRCGNCEQVVRQYEEELGLESANLLDFKGFIQLPRKERSLGLDLSYFLFTDAKKQKTEFLKTGEPAFLIIGCQSNCNWDRIVVHVIISEIGGDSSSVLVITNSSGGNFLHLYQGEQEVQLYFPSVCLKPGLYRMRVSIREDPLHILDDYDGLKLVVKSNFPMASCQFYQPRDWSVESRRNLIT
jgi:lipopolysaccharide transport system ATP-binding protein